MNEKEARKALDWFRVPLGDDSDSRVFILGCFARYATLYSQQVRALNLVTALRGAGLIPRGHPPRIAVIGAGAGGLMAAAGAAHYRASVEVFEELETPLAFQRNNRQRWLHPYIYDWPNEEDVSKNARLPLLNWSADYAHAVALTIEDRWKSLKASNASLTDRYNVDSLSIRPRGGKLELTWNDDKGARDSVQFDIVIVAVGFGLEKETSYSRSYWSEDDSDCIFRKSHEDQQWLVSGSGDGALTDLMRLCLKDFRHEKIASLFSTATDYESIKEELRQIHASPRAADPSWISEEFDKLSVGTLCAALKDARRKRGPEISLVTDKPLYANTSSILNRLVVRVLAASGAFKLLSGRTEIEPIATGFKVKLNGVLQKKFFNRVIVRHGPEKSFSQKTFPIIWKASRRLRNSWKGLSREEDLTRKRLWQPGSFGPEGDPETPEVNLRGEFLRQAEQFGLRAQELLMYKELKEDGTATIHYRIDGLTTQRETLRGIRIYYESTAGVIGSPELIGEPVLSATSKRLKHEWKRDKLADQSDLLFSSIEKAQEYRRKLSGEFLFAKPLKPFDPPTNIGFSFPILSGDAFSSWEFEQLYGTGTWLHFDNKPTSKPTEYLAKVVWFPIEKLTLSVSFPTRLTGPVSHSHFACPHVSDITQSEIVQNGIVQIYPPVNTKFSPAVSPWEREGTAGGKASGSLLSQTARTWELTVAKPSVGTCYSLDWELTQSSRSESDLKIERKVEQLRQIFLEHGERRRSDTKLDARTAAISKAFLRLYKKLYSKYGLNDPDERFEVSLMTYCTARKKLIVVEKLVSGDEADELWNFWLPFGFGLAGACFRQADRAFLYVRRHENEPEPAESFGQLPQHYIDVARTIKHDVLISLPINHPDYRHFHKNAVGFEQARKCVGIVNLGSSSERTKLRALKNKPLQDNVSDSTINRLPLVKLQAMCQAFCDEIHIRFGNGAACS